MKKLFLCHYREYAAEVELLAQTLRQYGIVPWLDREGGFQLGDGFVDEAKRVIRNECFGLLIYATPELFERPFILNVELHEAIEQKERDPNFVIITVLRGMSTDELKKLSISHLGVDLSLYHAYILPDTQLSEFQEAFTVLAESLLPRVLRNASNLVKSVGHFSLQLSTKDRLPDADDDVLAIDATVFSKIGMISSEQWAALAHALGTVKQQISRELGRPRLLVHGSKHLTTAMLLGYTFRASSGFQIALRHRDEYWSTDCPPLDASPFTVVEESGSYQTTSLFLEVNAIEKTVREAVRRYIQQSGNYPALTLRFSRDQSLPMVIDNATCCAMAYQIRACISKAIGHNKITDIHLFGVMPQALAMMIGYQLNALRPVQLYEYVQGSYQPSYRLLPD